MINGTNVLPEDNPPLGGINLPATRPSVIPNQPAGPTAGEAIAGRRTAPATGAFLGGAAAVSSGSVMAASMAGWLAYIVRRVGARLFSMNDAEARWRGWEIVELRGGMSRRYRDRRFATLRAPGETTLRPWDPQSPCKPRPAVPEPPGVHEDGGGRS